jgi:fatty acid desaturase
MGDRVRRERLLGDVWVSVPPFVWVDGCWVLLLSLYGGWDLSLNPLQMSMFLSAGLEPFTGSPRMAG